MESPAVGDCAVQIGAAHSIASPQATANRTILLDTAPSLDSTGHINTCPKW
jgi:hypothetical protein